MHKSRLYLTLSLVALLAAVVVSEFDLRCPLQSIAQCPFSTVCDPQPAEGDTNTYSDMYTNAINGRFDDAIRIAKARLKADPSDATTRLYLAYSLRGNQNPHEAMRQYGTVAIQTQAEDPASDWIVIDALTGRAACQTILGNSEAALSNLDRAMKLAKEQEERSPDTRSAYQLSCVYAQYAAAHNALKESWDETKAADNAERYLRLALDRGYDNRQHISADLDLDPLRGRASFMSLCK
jgi:tetratricopeptide (TPR) repeat protein